MRANIIPSKISTFNALGVYVKYIVAIDKRFADTEIGLQYL